MKDFREKQQYTDHYGIVEDHIVKYFDGARMNVFHEIPTLDIHMDVFHVKPTNADFELLVTSGMSSIAMNVSEDARNPGTLRFAELMVVIPKGIDFGAIFPSGSKHDWIISMLKQSAKFSHFYDTWIGVGHSIQAAENLEPYSKDTRFCGCIVLPTMTFPKEFQIIHSPHGPINIYGLFPLYKEELEFKIQNGYNAFAQLLIRNNAREVIDFKRKNYCKRGWW